jgi:menaquinone-9 beta-reductase
MAIITNQLMETYDVIIVGSGPGGAGAAAALAKSGLRTVILERATLPRDKVCTGVLFPSARKIISETFGELPENIFANPKEIKGIRIYNANAELMEFPWDVLDPGPGLPECGWNTYRAELDFWLCMQSDASLVGDCLFVDYRLDRDEILVNVKHNGRYRDIKTKFLVGADGMRSKVRRSLFPELEKSIGWLPIYKEWYEGSIDLQPGFMYFFLDRRVTDAFAGAFIKDKLVSAVTTVRQGKSSKKHLWQFRDILKEKYGLSVKRVVRTQGTIKNDMMVKRKYVFGRGNVLLAGEANGTIEGINAAMITGKAAGEAILKSIETGEPAIESLVKNDSLVCHKDRGEKIQEGFEAILGHSFFLRE